jgi:hypothetical protein
LDVAITEIAVSMAVIKASGEKTDTVVLSLYGSGI